MTETERDRERERVREKRVTERERVNERDSVRERHRHGSVWCLTENQKLIPQTFIHRESYKAQKDRDSCNLNTPNDVEIIFRNGLCHWLSKYSKSISGNQLTDYTLCD